MVFFCPFLVKLYHARFSCCFYLAYSKTNFTKLMKFERFGRNIHIFCLICLCQGLCQAFTNKTHVACQSCLSLTAVKPGAYGKAGIRNRKRSRKRKRNPNPNRNPNLRNKNWRRFCLESVTNNNCLVKTFHPHIIFIYCYYIFYCRIFCVRRKIFLREFHIRASVASWDHD